MLKPSCSILAPTVGSKAPSVCSARPRANEATSSSSVLTRTGLPTCSNNRMTSLVGSKRVQMRSTVLNQASARCTAGSTTSRGWSATTCTFTSVSMDTLVNVCRVRGPIVASIGLPGPGAGQGLTDGLAESHRAVGRATDGVHLRALAIDHLLGQAGNVAQRVLQRRAGDAHVGDATADNLDLDPDVAAPAGALTGVGAVLVRGLHGLGRAGLGRDRRRRLGSRRGRRPRRARPPRG